MSHVQTSGCEKCCRQIARKGHKFLGSKGLDGILMCPEFGPVLNSAKKEVCIAYVKANNEKNVFQLA